MVLPRLIFWTWECINCGVCFKTAAHLTLIGQKVVPPNPHHIGGVVKEVTINDLKDKKVAVDVSIWRYETTAFTKESLQSAPLRPYKSFPVFIRGVFARLLYLLQHNITPVIVFDGPSESTGLSKHRMNAWDYHQCLELLDALGIPYVNAEGDAEQTCAQLNRKGSGPLQCVTSRDLEAAGLGRRQLVTYALLVGCDAVPGVKGVGPAKAVTVLEELAEKKLDPLDRIRKWRAGGEDWTHMEDKVRTLALDNPDFPDEQVIELFYKDVNCNAVTVDWKKPGLQRLQDFLSEIYSVKRRDSVRGRVSELAVRWRLLHRDDPAATPLRIVKKTTKNKTRCYVVSWQLSVNKNVWTHESTEPVEVIHNSFRDLEARYLLTQPMTVKKPGAVKWRTKSKDSKAYRQLSLKSIFQSRKHSQQAVRVKGRGSPDEPLELLSSQESAASQNATQNTSPQACTSSADVTDTSSGSPLSESSLEASAGVSNGTKHTADITASNIHAENQHTHASSYHPRENGVMQDNGRAAAVSPHDLVSEDSASTDDDPELPVCAATDPVTCDASLPSHSVTEAVTSGTTHDLATSHGESGPVTPHNAHDPVISGSTDDLVTLDGADDPLCVPPFTITDVKSLAGAREESDWFSDTEASDVTGVELRDPDSSATITPGESPGTSTHTTPHRGPGGDVTASPPRSLDIVPMQLSQTLLDAGGAADRTPRDTSLTTPLGTPGRSPRDTPRNTPSNSQELVEAVLAAAAATPRKRQRSGDSQQGGSSTKQLCVSPLRSPCTPASQHPTSPPPGMDRYHWRKRLVFPSPRAARNGCPAGGDSDDSLPSLPDL